MGKDQRGKYQRRDKIARLISWGHWFTFTNIILCLCVGVLYIEASPDSSTVAGSLYMLVSWLGHFAFLPFVFFIILIFPFCLIIPYSRVLRGLAALVASFGLIALISDALFFRQYGYHLNTYSLAQMIKDAEAVFTGASFVIISAVLLGFLLIVGIELLLANLSWKRLDDLQRKRVGAPTTVVLVLCFFLSHSIHVWADASLYSPITQQDDMFPLSYPTTAKTLMAKHGVIDVESYQARQQMLMATDKIKLKYPKQPLLCSKKEFSQTATIILFDEYQHDIDEALTDSYLTKTKVNLLAHPRQEGGLFQFLYGLPDFYQDTIERQKVTPAYLKPLKDFNINVNWYVSGNWNNKLSLSRFSNELKVQSISNFPERSGQHINIILLTKADKDKLDRILVQSQQHQVLVSYLSPENKSELLGKEQFSLDNMSVPLWQSKVDLPNQPIAGLMDIMPTFLDSRIACAGHFKNYTNGTNLHAQKDRWPMVETYSPYIVIYDQNEVTILDNSGQFNVYSRSDFTLKKDGEPPVPVLINALKDLKRFTEPQNAEN